MRQRREQERFLREMQAEKAKRKMEEEQAKKLERLRKAKMNTASKQRKAITDGKSAYDARSAYDDGLSSYESVKQQIQPEPSELSPKRAGYRVRKNISKGLDPEEGKNTKVTLELLQKLHYKDIEQSLPDDFRPEKFITDPEDNNSQDDDSVFDYFFPGSKKKKPKKVKGENYSEKIMNIKKELNQNKMNPVMGNRDVIFEEQESMYKSDKEGSKNTKSHRSIQPSNPGQSFKSHRRAGSQINLHPKNAKPLVKPPKGQLAIKDGKKLNIKSLALSGLKKNPPGAMTSRRGPSAKKLNLSRSKSKDKSNKLHKSNQKSNIMSRVAKIEDMRKVSEKQSMNRAMKIHNNQLKKSQKFMR
jgi:hypothetical protein